MAATLANGGVNPVTGEHVVDRDVAAQVLAVMATCGMYDAAGDWLVRVGLPAKSGVSGCLLAASPGQFGIGLFSPRLDEKGNSVRAVAAGRTIAQRFGLHLMRIPRRASQAVYLAADATTERSARLRRRAEAAELRRRGAELAVRVVRGDVEFAEGEEVLRSLAPLSAEGGLGWLVLDLHRVTRLHPAAALIVEAEVARLVAEGVVVALADPDDRLPPGFGTRRFSSLAEALEWCEDQLLATGSPDLGPEVAVPLAEHDHTAGLDAAALAVLADVVPTRAYQPGDEVMTDDADLLVLVLSGRLATVRPGVDGGRTASLGPGTAIGHLAVLQRADGAHQLVAERVSEALVLRGEDLVTLQEASPGLVGQLWSGLTRFLTPEADSG